MLIQPSIWVEFLAQPNNSDQGIACLQGLQTGICGNSWSKLLSPAEGHRRPSTVAHVLTIGRAGLGRCHQISELNKN